jgi:hypothetical protein
MRRRWRPVTNVGLLAATLSCEDASRTALRVDAGTEAASATSGGPAAASVPVVPGCARSGSASFSALETDPSCIVPRAKEGAMRDAAKQLTITVTVDPAEVVAGRSANAVVTVRNASASDVDVLLEARTHAPGPRPDWSRVAGVPEQREPTAASDVPHLFLPMTTTDAAGHDVDAVPIVPGSTPAPASGTILEVHLRPGGKLSHTAVWWALHIPAPAPIVKDDAGHRYVPKTSALPLYPGDYNVVIELPLWGLTHEERKYSAHVHVTRPPRLDAGD